MVWRGYTEICIVGQKMQLILLYKTRFCLEMNAVIISCMINAHGRKCLFSCIVIIN